jgi:hypothetical protein
MHQVPYQRRQEADTRIAQQSADRNQKEITDAMIKFDRPAQSNHSTDPSPLAARKKRLSLLILLLGSLLIFVLLLSGSPASALAERPPLEEAPPLSFTYRQAGGKEHAKFTHRNAAHLRLPCLLCHRREVNRNGPGIRPVRDVTHRSLPIPPVQSARSVTAIRQPRNPISKPSLASPVSM